MYTFSKSGVRIEQANWLGTHKAYHRTNFRF